MTTAVRSEVPDRIIGVSQAFRRVLATADRFAPTPLAVLVVGETGTGKELIARRIHQRSGRTGEFLDINCSSLVPGLAESMLFGHRRGSFTGAFETTEGIVRRAAVGTLFLDEIDSLHLEVQASLLRLLETGEFRRFGDGVKRCIDLRVVSAVHEGIVAQVTEGRFRPDLFHRLAAAVIRIPPLRDRPDDLRLLASHFAREAYVTLSVEFVRFLLRHDWPGNVRELKSFIARAAIGAEGGELGRAEFLEAEASSGAAASPPASESEWLRVMCEQAGWNVEQAAVQAGIPRSTFYRKLRKHGIRIIRGAVRKGLVGELDRFGNLRVK